MCHAVASRSCVWQQREHCNDPEQQTGSGKIRRAARLNKLSGVRVERGETGEHTQQYYEMVVSCDGAVHRVPLP